MLLRLPENTQALEECLQEATNDMNPDRKIRTLRYILQNIKNIGSDTVFGQTYRLRFRDTKLFLLLKLTRVKSLQAFEALRREVEIGFLLNKLECPTFMRMYTGFEASRVLEHENKVYNFCLPYQQSYQDFLPRADGAAKEGGEGGTIFQGGERRRSPGNKKDPMRAKHYQTFTDYYLLAEYVWNGIPAGRYFRDIDRKHALYFFLQVFHALDLAQEKYRYNHRDLHSSNILVQKGQNVEIEIRGKKYRFPDRVVIIDYGVSSVYTSEHQSFYDALNTEVYGKPKRYYPRVDHYRILGSLTGRVYKDNKKIYPLLEEIFETLFPEQEKLWLQEPEEGKKIRYILLSQQAFSLSPLDFLLRKYRANFSSLLLRSDSPLKRGPSYKSWKIAVGNMAALSLQLEHLESEEKAYQLLTGQTWLIQSRLLSLYSPNEKAGEGKTIELENLIPSLDSFLQRALDRYSFCYLLSRLRSVLFLEFDLFREEEKELREQKEKLINFQTEIELGSSELQSYVRNAEILSFPYE